MAIRRYQNLGRRTGKRCHHQMAGGAYRRMDRRVRNNGGGTESLMASRLFDYLDLPFRARLQGVDCRLRTSTKDQVDKRSRHIDWHISPDSDPDLAGRGKEW